MCVCVCRWCGMRVRVSTSVQNLLLVFVIISFLQIIFHPNFIFISLFHPHIVHTYRQCSQLPNLQNKQANVSWENIHVYTYDIHMYTYYVYNGFYLRLPTVWSELLSYAMSPSTPRVSGLSTDPTFSGKVRNEKVSL